MRVASFAASSRSSTAIRSASLGPTPGTLRSPFASASRSTREQPPRLHAREDRLGELGPDAARLEQQVEELALERGREAEELDRVLAHRGVDQQRDGLAHLGQSSRRWRAGRKARSRRRGRRARSASASSRAARPRATRSRQPLHHEPGHRAPGRAPPSAQRADPRAARPGAHVSARASASAASRRGRVREAKQPGDHRLDLRLAGGAGAR